MALDIGRRRLRQAVSEARTGGGHVPTVVIIGGGLSGLAMGMQLVRAGVTEFTIVEQSDGVGGTWRDNTYPGSGCDVPSHLYSFSFASKTDWSRRFAEQPEILAYAEECVNRFGLVPHLRLRTRVDGATYDERVGTWCVSVTSADGVSDTIIADAVVVACGQLNRPVVPDIPGLSSFAGPAWHSARWDHGVDVAGTRVGVVGSGASAIQFVPPVAAEAESVTIFQRSTNYVAPKRDRVYSPTQRWLLQHVRAYELAYRWSIYWGLEARWLFFRKNSLSGRAFASLLTRGVRRRVITERLPESSVVPDYPIGCKRILISNNWYSAIRRPTVTVVDEPIDHIEADAIVTGDGHRHPVDTIIFGTGFDTTDFLAHLPVVGRGGQRLSETWAHGARAYLGVAVADFPNCYLLYGPNTNLGHNSILFMVERQVNMVLQALALQTEHRRHAGLAHPDTAVAVEVTHDALTREDRRTQRLMTGTVWVSSCRSWYKNASGRVTNNWPTWTVRYWFDTLRLRNADLVVSTFERPVAMPDGEHEQAVPSTPTAKGAPS